jgi:predicted branched-subunit amino acid permease
VNRGRIFRDAAAIGVAVGAYGLGFGAAGVTAGLSVPQTCALSLLAFTGASQFALVGVLGAGGSVAAGMAGALLLGSRNTLYAVRLAELLRLRGPRRQLAAQGTIDETTAMAVTAPSELAGDAFWSTFVAVYLCWNAATLLGALGAGIVDTRALGLDAAVGAAFLALLAPQITGRTAARVAIGGALIAAVAIPFTPAGVPVLLAAFAVVPAVVGGR